MLTRGLSMEMMPENAQNLGSLLTKATGRWSCWWALATHSRPAGCRTPRFPKDRHPQLQSSNPEGRPTSQREFQQVARQGGSDHGDVVHPERVVVLHANVALQGEVELSVGGE